MKKYEQDILFYLVPVVFSATYMTFFGTEISFSENAFLKLQPLLLAFLAGCSMVFEKTADNHRYRDLIVFVWFSKEIRLKSLCKNIGRGFFMILVFSLDIPGFPDWPHLVATGLTVIVLVFLVAGWFKTWSFWWWIFTNLIVLSGVFLAIAFIFRTIDVKFPEFALAIIGLAFLYKIRD